MKTQQCAVETCGRRHYSHRLCEGHLQQRREGKRFTPIISAAERAAAISKVRGDDRRRLYGRVSRMSQSPKTIQEQANAMRITVTRLCDLRSKAKRAGFFIRADRSVNRTGIVSPKWLELDEKMKFSCERCSLRGPCPNFPHRCLGEVTDYMRSGLPAGGEFRELGPS